jgi:hypothetical protein
MAEGRCKGRAETGVLVSDDSAWDTVMGKDVAAIYRCDANRVDSFMTGEKQGHFGTIMVRDRENGVETVGSQEVGDEIHGDRREW